MSRESWKIWIMKDARYRNETRKEQECSRQTGITPSIVRRYVSGNSFSALHRSASRITGVGISHITDSLTTLLARLPHSMCYWLPIAAKIHDRMPCRRVDNLFTDLSYMTSQKYDPAYLNTLKEEGGVS